MSTRSTMGRDLPSAARTVLVFRQKLNVPVGVSAFAVVDAIAIPPETPICPSEDVDAAWHLHLTYTRSYWKRFCGEVLGRQLHHEPTRGGPAENTKHLAMYEATLAVYREAFGEEPPRDIWTPARERF